MADIKDFSLPDLGEGLEEGEIVEWHVAVGDFVELNQPVCDVETAKAVVSVPSPYAGTVVEKVGDVGEAVPVGTVFLRIDVDVAGGQVADEQPDPATAGEAEAAAPGAGDGDDRPEREAAAAGDGDARGRAPEQPLVGYGEGRAGGGGRTTRRRRGRTRPDRAPATSQQAPSRPLAKPPVRRLAKDLGVDLEALAPGSGAGGVITRQDVRDAASGAPGTQPAGAAGSGVTAGPEAADGAPDTAAGASEAAAGASGIPGFRGRRPGDVEPYRGIRRRIAERMETARREIPEATCSREADVTALWELAGRLTDRAGGEGLGVRITPLVLVMRAAVLALRRYPALNAVLDRDAGEIRLLEPIHLGVATDTDRGLLVPTIDDAHTLSVAQLADRLAQLTAAARDGSIGPGELTGGTFTVNNYGALGADDGDPIINHPQAAILGIGAMRERPWVAGGQLAVRRTCTLTVAFDHRVCDGGEAARFVAELAGLCEEPDGLLLHA